MLRDSQIPIDFDLGNHENLRLIGRNPKLASVGRSVLASMAANHWCRKDHVDQAAQPSLIATVGVSSTVNMHMAASSWCRRYHEELAAQPSIIAAVDGSSTVNMTFIGVEVSAIFKAYAGFRTEHVCALCFARPVPVYTNKQSSRERIHAQQLELIESCHKCVLLNYCQGSVYAVRNGICFRWEGIDTESNRFHDIKVVWPISIWKNQVEIAYRAYYVAINVGPMIIKTPHNWTWIRCLFPPLWP